MKLQLNVSPGVKGRNNGNLQTRSYLLVQVHVEWGVNPRVHKTGQRSQGPQHRVGPSRIISQRAGGDPGPKTRSHIGRLSQERFLAICGNQARRKAADLSVLQTGRDMLIESALGALRLNEITNQQAQEFACQRSELSPSGINRGLRTLRRALNLAFVWGKLEKPCKLTLAAGEHQRDRVLTEKEIEKYLEACPQPWKDCAVLI